ncbi:MAG: Na/Pi cotransporter family protein [Planctomycetaceae bacterium]|jgi:phosphate:Na+ symporter|nr:Na/Pi cotransporter family protein [Planctomycetaceae bacterium]
MSFFPNSELVKYSSKFIVRLLYLAVLFFVTIFGVNVTLCANSIQSEKNSAGGSHIKQEFIRVIPDQRVQFTPNLVTSIDLFNSYEYLIDHSAQSQLPQPQLEFSIENSGGKNSDTQTAELKIVNDKLIINWKQIGKLSFTIKIVNSAEPSTEYFDKIKLEAWTFDYWRMSLTLLGGIGIFLLGMKYLSDGLQLVAGPSLRKMVSTVTDNRFFAVFVGIIATVAIQSSTATTVMVVGFINSQIMTLAQGIGVIMGANIGTTVTAWLLTLNISQYGMPILGLSAFVYIFARTEKTRLLAMAVMGVGALFLGLELMQQGFGSLKDAPEISRIIGSFSAKTYIGIWCCVSVGCVMTIILQSSSVTIAITISLAMLGVIEFETGAALVLGENIGTTLTAILASIGTSTNARRAAIFHASFNVIGVVCATLVFNIFFMPVIYFVVGTDSTGVIRNPSTGIALTHTLFNVSSTLLMLPFVRIAASILRCIVKDAPEEKVEGVSRLTTLGMHRLETPTIAIERSRIEVIRMGHICLQLAEKVVLIAESEQPDKELVDSAFHDEEVLDTLQDEIIAYTARLLSGNITHDLTEAAQQQIRMADELESISDYLVVILKSDIKLRKDGLAIPQPQKAEFKEIHELNKSYTSMVVQFYSTRKNNVTDLMTEVYAQGHNLTRKVKSVRDQFIKRMSAEHCDPQVVIAFNTQINAFRRVREHTQNVAEAISGQH